MKIRVKEVNAAVIASVIFLIGLSISLGFFSGPSYGQGYGASSVTIAPSSVNVSQGSTESISFTVKLASGGTWGTQFESANSSLPSGLSITGLPSGVQDPPFSGSFSVSVANGILPGIYELFFKATGDDPSSSDAVLTLNVAAARVQNSSKTVSNVTSSNTTSNNVSKTNTTMLPSLPLPPPPFGFGTPFPFGSTSVYGFVGLTILALSFIFAFLSIKTKRIQSWIKPRINYFVGLAVIAGAYLLAFDKNLLNLGFLHWEILLAYTLFNSLLLLIIWLKEDYYHKLPFFVIPTLFVFAMLIDLVANLPFTALYSGSVNVSWPYLFGFGLGPSSSFGNSVGFSLVLFSSILIALRSAADFFRYKK
jgi:hypothetical protein